MPPTSLSLNKSPVPQPDPRYLRAVITFFNKALEEQAKQIPLIGPALLGFAEAAKELSAADDGDQSADQLQQQLAQLLTQGERAQQFNEGFAAVASLLLEQQYKQTALFAQLTAHLHALGLPTEQKQLTGFALNTALTAYQQSVVRTYQYADQRGVQGVAHNQHVAAMPLTDIYVKPRLQAERSAARSLFEPRAREHELLRQMLDNQDLPLSRRAGLEEEFALLTGARWRGKKEQAEALNLGQVLQRARHAVILGGPGVGKSQLTRYLALVCARGPAVLREQLDWAEELTPLVVSLARFTHARGSQPALTLRQYLDAELEARGGAALRAAMAEELAAGRVLVLLDGVDEAPDHAQRLALVAAVDAFLREHAAVRCLVTSRPYGYVRLAGEVEHFELLNFSEEQVSQFIHGWQRAFEAWLHRDAPDFARAEREAAAMLGELRGSPKVFELAANPLMLVIMALIRHKEVRLPRERVRLYDTAVKTLMETWNDMRAVSAGLQPGAAPLKVDDLIIVWSAAAVWLHTKPTGVAYRAELVNKLVEILIDEDLGGRRPAETANAYLDVVVQRAGLLEERSPDIFAFWHLTFEEFLAAVKLTTPASRAQVNLLPLRHDPRWREVILLAVGYLGLIQRDRETVSDLVRALAFDAPDALEPVLHRNLLLAAACVAEDAGVNRKVGEEVIVALGKVVREQPYEQLCEAFAETVQALPELCLSAASVTALAPLAGHKDWRVRMEAARLFSNVAAEQAEARGLCERLFEDEYQNVKCPAALGLARAGELRAAVLQALLWYRSDMARIEKAVLAFFATADARVSEVLFGWLSDADAWLRVRAARLLIELGQADARVVETLFGLLSDADTGSRLEAAKLLQELGRADERVVETLFGLLSDADKRSRLEAARLLQELGQADARVSEVLFGWLSDADAGLRYQAAQLLRELGQADARVSEVLFGLLSDADAGLRYHAAGLLWELGQADARVREVLLGWLSDADAGLRYEAARLLRELAVEDQPLDEQLLERLLGLAGPSPPAALTACRKLLDGQEPEAADGLALAELVRPHDGDTAVQGFARKELFAWLWRKQPSPSRA